jgi:hypothetical protein
MASRLTTSRTLSMSTSSSRIELTPIGAMTSECDSLNGCAKEAAPSRRDPSAFRSVS